MTDYGELWILIAGWTRRLAYLETRSQYNKRPATKARNRIYLKRYYQDPVRRTARNLYQSQYMKKQRDIVRKARAAGIQ